MITRIVKMSFEPAKTEEFKAMFDRVKNNIASFPGCKGVELLNDVMHPNVFFTYSKWNSLDDLENYRKSDLFNSVWAQTKIHFNDKPQAWSVNSVSGFIIPSIH